MMFKFIILLISSYLLVSCSSSSEKNDQSEKIPEKEDEFMQARQIMMESAQTLQSRVKWALEVKTMEQAVNYCNVEGNLLLDSLSRVYNAEIGRVSHKPRATDNVANKTELSLIAKYQENLQKGEGLHPEKIITDHADVFYFPIVIQSEMCLRCHGMPGENFSPREYISIKLQYPEDQAIGFKMGDLRGLWKIQIQQFADAGI